MSGNSNIKTTHSIKKGYEDRPSPRDVAEEFQEEYVEACHEVNELLIDADHYFAFDEAQKALEDEEGNFREDNQYKLSINELVSQLEYGELVDEEELYEELVTLAGSESIENVSQLSATVLSLTSKRDSIGQSMDYNNPVSWMMYKREAYDGQSREQGDSNNEIATMGDLRKHANGQDLCQKRYEFLNQYTTRNEDWHIDSETDLPSEMPLEDVYTDERLLGLLVTEEFMGDAMDGANVVDVFGNDLTADVGLKEDGRGSWLGNEKDMDGKWANFEA